MRGIATGAQARRIALCWAGAAILGLVGTAPGRAVIQPSGFADLTFDQRPGANLPDAVLRDEAGREVRLASVLDGKPAVLALEYLRCPNLCGLVLGGLVDGLAKSEIPAADYRVVALSIDPSESSADAAQARTQHAERSGTDAVRNWTFLTGDAAEIRRVADAVGFRYRLDPASGQYAHAAGIAVVTPSAQVSRYLLGVDFAPSTLRQAIAEAGHGTIAAPASPLLLLCYDYDPASGSYTPSIMKLVRWGGVLTVALGGLLLAMQFRRETRG
jgi:protein SCO1/2